jgi:hypothetical protein
MTFGSRGSRGSRRLAEAQVELAEVADRFYFRFRA